MKELRVVWGSRDELVKQKLYFTLLSSGPRPVRDRDPLRSGLETETNLHYLRWIFLISARVKLRQAELPNMSVCDTSVILPSLLCSALTDRLYFATLRVKPKNTASTHYFCTDEFVYERWAPPKLVASVCPSVCLSNLQTVVPHNPQHRTFQGRGRNIT